MKTPGPDASPVNSSKHLKNKNNLQQTLSGNQKGLLLTRTTLPWSNLTWILQEGKLQASISHGHNAKKSQSKQ